jgi:hypothetical protein
VPKCREWSGNCQRCFAKSDIHTMSMFDVSLICITCSDTEKKHPDYEKARSAEQEAVRQGDYNFKGIGWRPTYPMKDLGNDPRDW